MIKVTQFFYNALRVNSVIPLRFFSSKKWVSIILSLLCCSCSNLGLNTPDFNTLGSQAGSVFAQPSDSNTGAGETKQGNSSLAPLFTDDLFNQLVQEVNYNEKKSRLIKLFAFDEKYNDLSMLAGSALGENGIFYLYGNNGVLVPYFDTGSKDPLSVAFSAKAALLAVSTVDGLKIYNLRTKSVAYQLRKLKTRINSVDFDSNAETLLIGGTDANVYRWKFAKSNESIRDKEKALERYIGHSAIVSKVLYHPHNRVFFSADWSGKVVATVRYDADAFEGEYEQNATAGRPFTIESLRVGVDFKADGNVEALQCSDDGELLAIAADTGQIALILVRGFRGLVRIPAHHGLIYDLDFSHDGKEIVTVGRDNHLRIWTVGSFELVSMDPTKATLTLSADMLMPNAERVVRIGHDKIAVAFKDGTLQIISRSEIPLVAAIG